MLMTGNSYCYEFRRDVPMQDVEASLQLAFLATESLHGETQVRLDAAHSLNHRKRCCMINVQSRVGRDISRIFTGFLRHEFGEDAFSIKRQPNHHKALSEETFN
jgi:hypothetical protein